MRRSLSVLFVLAALWLARAIPAQNPSTTPDDPKNPPLYAVSEAYDLYSSILESQSQAVQKIVVTRETEPRSLCFKPSDEADISIRAAMVDYAKANQNVFELQPAFQVSKPYSMVSRQDLDQLTTKNFNFTYPNSGGVQTFSAVGFDSNKTVAVVYHSQVRHALSGSGAILVFHKVDGKWKPYLKAMCRWIS